MKQDMLLRQRPYMFVERPTSTLNDKEEIIVEFVMRNSGALPASVQAHVRLTISPAAWSLARWALPSLESA
jgi:hypothetical protein